MKVYVCTPMHDRPTANFTLSLTEFLVRAARMLSLEAHWAPLRQVSNLAEARCLALHDAVTKSYDKLLFIDDDMDFLSGQPLKLLEIPGEVVSAVCRVKKPEVQHAGYTLEDAGRQGEKQGTCIGMAAVGMALTVIDLPFVRKMVETGNNFRFFKHPLIEGRIPGLFEFKVAPDASGEEVFMGEDEVFCKHVLDAGGKIWLRTDCVVGHVGHTVYR
jgi:hypothetical protein